MPRRSQTPEASTAQFPPQSHSHPDPDARSPRAHKKHHRSHRSHRSRSPRRDDDTHRHKRHRSRSPAAPRPIDLPYKAQPLSKRHYEDYKPLFQSYLDIQKNIQLDSLDEREIKGRWKSFVSRWNRGELARSWYDPSMLKTATETVQMYRGISPGVAGRRASPSYARKQGEEEVSDASDDDFGPAPPTNLPRHSGHGPTIPNMDDLTLRNELVSSDLTTSQSHYLDSLRHARKTDRQSQKAALDDLIPRADPNTRDRQLEKKREVTSTLNSFRDAKEAGEVDVPESDLMGDDGIDVYKKKKKEQERQKNEREIRREEIARAREAERNERLSERREKEAGTMEFLRRIAKERFG
ncbi:uncharacterized protein J4E84_001433 [Alternaria hordeiaustralica]|uniref:uncharacterized protein n=1 Tax=Alternaria hordeiaustralica TaxID=1187925 RepID=UPI0020C22202|nr:uncharacterized protein J4E84_001433 [Alternaria hordeiaustralica]KAI4698297.1 hypothetical protein J4E84_001433 [Alternaria hordeiaustralica]